jgi:hypothetical protein
MPGTARRTIYGLIDRQNLPGLFRAFDFASPDTHSPQRFTTTVPQQALFMMNSPFLRDRAGGLAARGELTGLPDARSRVEQLYRLVLCRLPNEQELTRGVAFLTDEESRSAPLDSPSPGVPRLSAWERYVQVVLLSNEFVYVD